MQDKNFFSIGVVHDLEEGSLEGSGEVSCAFRSQYIGFSANSGHTYDLGMSGSWVPWSSKTLSLLQRMPFITSTEETLLIFSPDGVTELEIHEEQLSQAKG